MDLIISDAWPFCHCFYASDVPVLLGLAATGWLVHSERVKLECEYFYFYTHTYFQVVRTP